MRICDFNIDFLLCKHRDRLFLIITHLNENSPALFQAGQRARSQNNYSSEEATFE